MSILWSSTVRKNISSGSTWSIVNHSHVIVRRWWMYTYVIQSVLPYSTNNDTLLLNFHDKQYKCILFKRSYGANMPEYFWNRLFLPSIKKLSDEDIRMEFLNISIILEKTTVSEPPEITYRLGTGFGESDFQTWMPITQSAFIKISFFFLSFIAWYLSYLLTTPVWCTGKVISS